LFRKQMLILGNQKTQTPKQEFFFGEGA